MKKELLIRKLHLILGLLLRLANIVVFFVFCHYAYLFAIEELIWWQYIFKMFFAILGFGFFRFGTRLYFKEFDYEPWGMVLKFFYRPLL